MQIRPFKEQETEAVISLWQRCGVLRSWNDPLKDIKRKLQVQPELFLVGLVDDKIIATAMGGYDGHRGWVNYLAVDPDHQHKGHGGEIMTVLETALKALGCPKLNLQIRSDNAAAITFYEQAGYKQDAVLSYGKRLIPDG